MSLRHPRPGGGSGVYRDPQLGFVGVGAAPSSRWGLGRIGARGQWAEAAGGSCACGTATAASLTTLYASRHLCHSVLQAWPA